MINTIKKYVNRTFKRIELSKINFLNHKFKKFIIKYEEIGNNIKIYNSNGDTKIVNNSIPNKVKVMEIVKEHKDVMDKEIEYYESNKDDYTIMLITSSLFIIALGITFLLSFFVGSYILFLLTTLAFSASLAMFGVNTYKILLFREEVKRLKSIKNNKIELDNNELKEIAKDSFVYVKKYYYNILLKFMNLVDNIKVKFN